MKIRTGVSVPAALVALSLLFAACGEDDGDTAAAGGGGGDQSAELQKVKLGTAAPLTHGYYPLIAEQALGYCKDEGLDVEIVPSGDEIPIPALLENGQIDVALAGASEIIFAVGEGSDLWVVGDPWTRTAEGIVTIDPEIQDAADLKGKTVGLNGDEDEAFLGAVLNEVGLKLDDVDTVVIGEGAPVVANALEDGKVDAYSSTFNVFATIKVRGLDLRDLTPESLVGTPSVSFVVTGETRDSDPEMIEKLMRCFNKGVWVGQVDPAATTAMYKEIVPEDWREPEIAEATLQLALPLYDPVNDDEIGELIDEKWTSTEEGLIGSDQLEAPVNIQERLDPQFLAAANDFDREEVKADAAAWLEENR